MNKELDEAPRSNGHWAFFSQFLKNPRQIGSIIPSSRYLEARIMAAAKVAEAGTIVELGPGTGGTSAAILRSMGPRARLLSIEINAQCFAHVKRIRDPRFIAHYGSAADLQSILVQYDLPAPEAIISGIPFSTMTRAEGADIMQAIAAALAPGGRFVAYQVNRRVGELGDAALGKGEVAVEYLNIPPLRVFTWHKR